MPTSAATPINAQDVLERAIALPGSHPCRSSGKLIRLGARRRGRAPTILPKPHRASDWLYRWMPLLLTSEPASNMMKR